MSKINNKTELLQFLRISVPASAKMPKCSAANCSHMGSHTFPKNPELRKVWEEAVNKENFKASKHSRLCSRHFRESDYNQVSVTTGMAPFHRYLKKTAVPSIFNWNKTSPNVTHGVEVKDISAKPSSVRLSILTEPRSEASISGWLYKFESCRSCRSLTYQQQAPA